MKFSLLILLLGPLICLAQPKFDTLKCIVQSYNPNNGFTYLTPQFFAIRGWVVRKIEKRDNYSDLPRDVMIDDLYKEEWLVYIPIKFLLNNKKTEVKDVWMPDGQPQYMLKDW